MKKNDFNKKVVWVNDGMDVLNAIPYGVPVNISIELIETIDEYDDPEYKGIRATIRRVSDGCPETPFEEWAEELDAAREEADSRYGFFRPF